MFNSYSLFRLFQPCQYKGGQPCLNLSKTSYNPDSFALVGIPPFELIPPVLHSGNYRQQNMRWVYFIVVNGLGRLNELGAGSKRLARV